MKLTPGTELSARTRAEVLRAYIYRWTSDNTALARSWAGLPAPTMPLVTDAEWLATHAFWTNRDGSLTKNRRYAEPWYPASDSTKVTS